MKRCSARSLIAVSAAGPALVATRTSCDPTHIRQSDDEKQYRCAEEIEDETHNDPILRFRALLLSEGIATEDDIKTHHREVE